MNKYFLLLSCLIISASSSGCILSRSILYINDQEDHLEEIHSASIEKNKITIDYTVRRSRGHWGYASYSRKVKMCSNYYIAKGEVSIDTQYKNQGIMVVPERKDDHSFNVQPEINIKGNKVVFHEWVQSSQCSRNQKEQGRKVDFLVSQDSNLDNARKSTSYKEEWGWISHYFFYIYKDEAQNEVHIVGLQPVNRSFTPWYGPLLIPLLPVAFAIDVLAFPIELMFYGEGKTLM